MKNALVNLKALKQRKTSEYSKNPNKADSAKIMSILHKAHQEAFKNVIILRYLFLCASL